MQFSKWDKLNLDKSHPNSCRVFIFPVAMLGLWLGMESSKIMNDAIARKILLVVLIFSSLGLVFNNL